MRQYFKKTIFFSLFCILPLMALEFEEISWETEGQSAHEFNGHLQQALLNQDWWAVVDYANILSYNFPTSPFAQDAAFLIGEAYLSLGHPFQANEYFSAYLKTQTSPRRFEEAIAHKFNIAERFAQGEKKPLFDSHKSPKWLSAKEDAITIYEEVIATVPFSEFAAKSLLNKAKLHAELEDYKLSLETLDQLIRRFPKHELTAVAYLEKMHVYHMQCEGRSLDPDLLDLAEVTLRKFRLVFPRESRLQEAEEYVLKMEEAFAQNLVTTGSFFQKTKKIPAAKIYYKKAISKYPRTPAALVAQEKLKVLSLQEINDK